MLMVAEFVGCVRSGWACLLHVLCCCWWRRVLKALAWWDTGCCELADAAIV